MNGEMYAHLLYIPPLHFAIGANIMLFAGQKCSLLDLFHWLCIPLESKYFFLNICMVCSSCCCFLFLFLIYQISHSTLHLFLPCLVMNKGHFWRDNRFVWYIQNDQFEYGYVFLFLLLLLICQISYSIRLAPISFMLCLNRQQKLLDRQLVGSIFDHTSENCPRHFLDPFRGNSRNTQS